MDQPRPNLKDAPGLIAQAISELGNLISSEVQLAKKEISQSISNAGFGVVMVVVAAFLALTAFHAIAILAAIALVSAGLTVLVSASIVTGVLVLLALVCALIGKAKLSRDALAPSKTLKNVKSDIAIVKEATRV